MLPSNRSLLRPTPAALMLCAAVAGVPLAAAGVDAQVAPSYAGKVVLVTGSTSGLGREVAGSRAFAVCQVEKVFAQVCFRPPESTDDVDAIEAIATDFENDGYSMKQVFADVAVYCTAGE